MEKTKVIFKNYGTKVVEVPAAKVRGFICNNIQDINLFCFYLQNEKTLFLVENVKKSLFQSSPSVSYSGNKVMSKNGESMTSPSNFNSNEHSSNPYRQSFVEKYGS